jgi:hypothetical protein
LQFEPAATRRHHRKHKSAFKHPRLDTSRKAAPKRVKTAAIELNDEVLKRIIGGRRLPAVQ